MEATQTQETTQQTTEQTQTTEQAQGQTATEQTGGQQQAAQKTLTAEEIERKKEKAKQRWDKMLHKQGELKGQLRAYQEIYGPLAPDGSPRQRQEQQEQRPKRDQFGTEDEYQDALEGWRDNKAEQRLEKERQSLREEFSGRQNMVAASTSFAKQEAEAKKLHSDYDEVVAEAEDVPVPQGVVREILSSDIGAEIKYYLAQHPEEAYSLNEMPLNAAIRKIGVIEGKLLALKDKKPSKSNAPDPINPPAGNGNAGSENHLDPDVAKKMPMDKWARLEEERMKKLKRR